MNEIEIHKTDDYGKFKYVGANRELDKGHVKRLVESIKKKNMLSVSPCIVGSEFEVIDGQHRIEAARILKVPIYYFFADDLTHEDILALNNVKKAWKTEDYFNFFTIKKYPNFATISNWINKTGFSLQAVLTLLSSDGRPRLRDMKQGIVDVSMAGFAPQILDAVYDWKKAYQNYGTPEFIRAIRWSVLDELPVMKKSYADYFYNRDLIKGFLESNPDFSLTDYYSFFSFRNNPKYHRWDYLKHDVDFIRIFSALQYEIEEGIIGDYLQLSKTRQS